MRAAGSDHYLAGKIQTLVLNLAVLGVLLTVGAGQEQQKPPIDWQEGPVAADLGGMAEIQVPKGFLFTDRKGTQKLLELTQNIPNGNEVGAIIPAQEDASGHRWFVIFEFHDIGFVKDDEKGKIDAPALLKSIQEGTEEGNEERKEKGWAPFHVVGWESAPYYDQATNNLTWAIRGRDDSGSQSVNHSIRILGRHGTMNVDLVLGPDEYATTLPAFNNLMGSFQFRQGSRYADFIKGDKVAKYGLTALIAGGAGALAVKTGLFMKMWKFLLAIILALKKAIIVLVAGLAAAIKKLWKKLFGPREEFPSQHPEDSPAASSESHLDAGPAAADVETKFE